MIILRLPQLDGPSTSVWSQPLAPLHSLVWSALIAVIPLAVVLILMGVFRKGEHKSVTVTLAETPK